MPENIVKKEFRRIFGTEHFVINEEAVFNFNKHSEFEVKSEYESLRGLALKLPSTERYANTSFTSNCGFISSFSNRNGY